VGHHDPAQQLGLFVPEDVFDVLGLDPDLGQIAVEPNQAAEGVLQPLGEIAVAGLNWEPSARHESEVAKGKITRICRWSSRQRRHSSKS
jgi:hypothetical protein